LLFINFFYSRRLAIIKEAAGHVDYSTTMGYTHIQLSEKLKAVNEL
jgi:site-specific recombinase XerD